MNAVRTTAVTNVAPGYVHFDKFIEPGENIDLGFTTLKWHNLAKSDEPVPREIYDLARAFLRREASIGMLDQLGDLGFVILHRCGKSFYFLLISTWKNENEAWETVYAKDGEGQADFAAWEMAAPHHAVYCVWELAAVWHEQQSWRKFLLSPRDEEAKSVYLQNDFRSPA